MIRLLAFCLALLLAGPVAAHSLRVFARTDGTQVSGYGFFVGGGRPQGVAWLARMGPDPIAKGRTDAEGGFVFAAPVPVTGPVTVTLDTAEGHIASATLPPERFGAAAVVAPPAPPPAPQTAPQPAAAPVAAPAADPAAAQVEAAVARQVAPLLDRIDHMDARMRLTDVISGLFLIIGLAGIALWARSRAGGK